MERCGGDIIPVLSCATLLSKAGSNWLETIIASHLSLFWLISFLFLFHLHVCWKQKRGGMSLMALAFCARTAGHVNPCSSDSSSPLRSKWSWVHFKTWLHLPNSLTQQMLTSSWFSVGKKRRVSKGRTFNQPWGPFISYLAFSMGVLLAWAWRHRYPEGEWATLVPWHPQGRLLALDLLCLPLF